MEGIILFADDFVFDGDSFENKIFTQLKRQGFPVLPIDGLDDFEKTIKSISTFKAIILDWEFIETLEDIQTKKNPLDILLSKDLFSLIFIYTNTNLSEETTKQLEERFIGKVFFLQKIKEQEQIQDEINKILAAIKKFEEENTHLATPYKWSNAINNSVQTIFKELESADKFWIKDLYYSSYMFAKNGDPVEPPPVDPNIQVINLFQNLLSEKLIQNVDLQQSIGNYSKDHLKDVSKDEDLQNLYRRLYYTNTLTTDTIMTGDVFQFDDTFGIVISPECDMNTLIKKNSTVEVLCFKKDSFKNILSILNLKATDTDKISRAYNQESPRIHLLPVFPIDGKMSTMLIDFRFDLHHFDGSYLEKNIALRTIKINSPYIQQLRQRYLSYLGRVGVPAIPSILRVAT